ncbi:MAG: AAA family ATPase [Deltaproteobacteria bacterium]|nr:AAA family ATPase [Deltaproteobacteria bacterium]
MLDPAAPPVTARAWHSSTRSDVNRPAVDPPGPLGDEASSILGDEQSLCDRVTTHLQSRRPSKAPPRVGDENALITLRDQVAVSRLEDVPALIAQMEQVAAIAGQRGQGTDDPVDPKSPYFGHLRLAEEGRGVRDVLIGKTTYVEPKAGVRIVDWRHAPVSQLYYRYDEGAAYEEEFGDREVVGKVLARRTVTIVDGELHRISCPQGTFVRRHEGGWRELKAQQIALTGGQGTAVRAEHMRGVLGAGGAGGSDQREDRHLPEIAALLDPRQFEVISKPDSGVVVVQGGAGSGKTTIGVHRMAYLAYQSRARFAPDRMLVIVGTPALRDYIAQLLEALDLGQVKVATFASWATELRQKNFDWLGVGTDDGTPLEVSRLKTDPNLLPLLERRARGFLREGRNTPEDALWLWAEVLTDRESLKRALLGVPNPRMTEEQLNRAWRHCSERCPAVAEWTADDATVDTEGDAIEGADGREEGDDRALLDPEDDALLLRAYQLICGPLSTAPRGQPRRRMLSYEHLFVDEAQDLAALDLCVLADVVTDQKSITLAGDTAQRLHLDTGFAHWDEVLGALKLDHTSVEPLKIAYRCTREVLDVARDVLGPLADPEAPVAPRSGAPVELHTFPSQGAAAAFLGDVLRPLFAREPRATVAVLARYPEQADAYYDALRVAEVPNLRRVRSFDFAFKPGVEVTEIRQVKGLEYDYVILVDANASTYPAEDEARYQLHIGATRAAHQLWIVTSGTPSPLLPRRLLDGEA